MEIDEAIVPRLRHDAFVYDSDAAYADRLVPFLATALEDGEAAVAVTTRANCALLRDGLGDDAERVSFVDRDEWYVRPAQVIAGFDRTVRERLRAGAQAVSVVGEVRFGATPREWAEWTAYESIINRAFAGQPAWIVCPYDARVLPDAVLDGAARTHPHVLTDAWRTSVRYHDPEELVRELTPEPEPLEGLRTVPLAPDDPEAFRGLLRREMAADGCAGEGIEAMALAAGEVLSNALTHGGGVPRLRLGRAGDRFVCELSDDGPGLDDPLAGYLPPAEGRGGGLWVARQAAARLELIPRTDGLTVRLWV